MSFDDTGNIAARSRAPGQPLASKPCENVPCNGWAALDDIGRMIAKPLTDAGTQ